MSTFWKLFSTPDTLHRADAVLQSCCFVTDIPPCTNYSGGIFVGEMLHALRKTIRSAFVVLDPVLQPQLSAITAEMDILTVPKPVEQYYNSQTDSEKRQLEQESERTVSAEILPQLLDFAARSNTQAFWVLLEGQTMIRLACQLIRFTTLPVIVQVMDPPLNWLNRHNVDEITQAEVFEQYEAVLRSAVCCACASWAMAEAYSEQFLTRCVPVVPSLPASYGKRARAALAGSDVLRIGFAGQVYAIDEWERIIRVLDTARWTIAGKRVEFHAFATWPQAAPQPQREGHLFFREWLQSASDLIEELSHMDLLYVPYRFSAEHSEEARLCFPSKLTTCLASGVPVLLHGPAYSSPARFAAKRRAAFICDTPSDTELMATLNRAITDREEYECVAANGSAAFESCLTHDVLAASIRQAFVADQNMRYRPALSGVMDMGA